MCLPTKKDSELFCGGENTVLKESTAGIENVEIVSYSGLLAQYCKERKVDAIVKGLRAVSDFEYEFQQALTNKRLNPQLETIF